MKRKARTPPDEPAPATAGPNPTPAQAPDPALDAGDADEGADDEGAVDAAEGRIVERPDGYHWITLDGTREFGPFETVGEAQADMDAADDNAPEPTQTLQEAERDIGMADWIDPQTGEPAEGQSPPHLEEE